MPEQTSMPFQSFSFSLVEDRRPRALLRMSALDDELYELHVEKGSAARPISQFTRKVPRDVAQRFKDALQAIGVFGWAEEFGNVQGGPTMRWSVSTVFKEGVFSVASKGGNDTPAGFDAMLEELYRLDFPRPNGGDGRAASAGRAAGPTGGFGDRAGGSDIGRDVRGGSGPGFDAGLGLGGGGFGPGAGDDLGRMLGSAGIGNIGGLSAGDLSAYSAAGGGISGGLDALSRFGSARGAGGGAVPGSGDTAGVDFAQLADDLGGAGLDGFDGFDGAQMSELIAEAQRNPRALQERMREEFRHMSPDEQNRMLDALAATGTASRAWWERFLRG